MLSVSVDARIDILEAAQWYEHQQPGLGAEFVHEIDAIFDRIDKAPLQFPVVYRELRRALVRRFPYAVYFESGTVGGALMIAILHQRRDRTVLDERSRG